MVLIYTSAGCSSCKKAKQWLRNNNITFAEKNIFSTFLKAEEVRYLVSRCENGFDDIISKNSKVVKQSKLDLNNLSFNEMVSFIRQNPSSLRRPILINSDDMVIGYDEDDIEVFLSSSIKERLTDNCRDDCPNYSLCRQTREEA